MPKLPALMFYTGDWMADPGVRSLSFAARGLWIDMLCLMSESQPRGYLKLNGRPVSVDQLARMTGGQPDEVSRLLMELKTARVFSTERGVIYSRRIVRDEANRLRAQENGRRGGNPKLTGGLTPSLTTNPTPLGDGNGDGASSEGESVREGEDPRTRNLRERMAK